MKMMRAAAGSKLMVDDTVTIRVEVKNDILGNCIFWEGPPASIHQIRNIPAREAAKLVVQDGVSRVDGIWYVSVLREQAHGR